MAVIVDPAGRRRDSGAEPVGSERRDLISSAASMVATGAKWYSIVLALFVIGVLAYLVWVDWLTRLIVLITIGVMVLIAMVYRGRAKIQSESNEACHEDQ